MTLYQDMINELSTPPCLLREILEHFELDLNLPEDILDVEFSSEFLEGLVLETFTDDLIIISKTYPDNIKSVLRIQPNNDTILSEECYDEHGKRMRGGTEYVRQGPLIAIVTLD